MTIEKKGERLLIQNRHLSQLDLFVSRVLYTLTKYSPYVIVSGYVAILFGRSRSTEDIDILIPYCDLSLFHTIHDTFIEDGYEFLNAEDASGLYSILASGSAIRLCQKDSFIPNIEIKFIKNESDEYSFTNRIELIIDGKNFWISPLEIQIAFKFWLGSEKDIEDAIFIREVCRDVIDEDLIREFCLSFGVKYETS
ncbi:MAG TPA: hypothetical protein PK024_06120 [Methanospirillum sp.]|uniref:hypothetical protein n=1 Tax=Methanospirillum sp. TaxID=45200 RepID=UPI002D1445F9|nr:hypothetical protein [Methanospirillum sp.]HOJ96398.1 hypothetical protein [Methanospirillum sp.]HPP79191.1 hypothetical protein [Methanospirillum sp.]